MTSVLKNLRRFLWSLVHLQNVSRVTPSEPLYVLKDAPVSYRQLEDRGWEVWEVWEVREV
jgi:hypothetical protein